MLSRCEVRPGSFASSSAAAAGSGAGHREVAMALVELGADVRPQMHGGHSAAGSSQAATSTPVVGRESTAGETLQRQRPRGRSHHVTFGRTSSHHNS